MKESNAKPSNTQQGKADYEKFNVSPVKFNICNFFPLKFDFKYNHDNFYLTKKKIIKRKPDIL